MQIHLGLDWYGGGGGRGCPGVCRPSLEVEEGVLKVVAAPGSKVAC